MHLCLPGALAAWVRHTRAAGGVASVMDSKRQSGPVAAFTERCRYASSKSLAVSQIAKVSA